MLQINLLPVRQLKKRARAKKQLAFMALSLVAFCLLLVGIGLWQLGNISSLQSQKEVLEQEKKELAPVLAKMKALKEKEIELQRKTDIIKKLRQESPLTVRILDEVANRLDNQRMWLTRLEQQSGSLTLTGMALDNQTVAQFMDNLAASEFVTDVALGDSSLTVISGRNLKRFTLNCAVAYPKEEQEEGAIAQTQDKSTNK